MDRVRVREKGGAKRVCDMSKATSKAKKKHLIDPPQMTSTNDRPISTHGTVEIEISKIRLTYWYLGDAILVLLVATATRHCVQSYSSRSALKTAVLGIKGSLCGKHPR